VLAEPGIDAWRGRVPQLVVRDISLG
jgi:hypothetical protein